MPNPLTAATAPEIFKKPLRLTFMNFSPFINIEIFFLRYGFPV